MAENPPPTTKICNNIAGMEISRAIIAANEMPAAYLLADEIRDCLNV